MLRVRGVFVLEQMALGGDKQSEYKSENWLESFVVYRRHVRTYVYDAVVTMAFAPSYTFLDHDINDTSAGRREDRLS